MKLSQMALAERVGCSTTLIGNIETQKRFPSPENLNAIADAFGVHPSDLFMEESPGVDRIIAASDVKERIQSRLLQIIDEEMG